MEAKHERILLVESDPEISDLISRQTLSTLGYQVLVTRTVADALREAVRFSPDIIISNLHLPDLSGKDLLVALNAQGLDIPVITIAAKGMEADLISALRLGAADYCMMPVREVEIVSTVERVSRQTHTLREREALSLQLKHTNHELQQRVRELTTIINIGKAVTSITKQQELLEKIIEGAIYVSSADAGWFLLRQEQAKIFHLVAQKNLPTKFSSQINTPWDDGISGLVAISGEPLSIHGEPINRFKISQLGQAALVVPVKLKREVIGLMVVIRKKPVPFTTSNSTLVEAVADYASISLMNSMLFRSLENRAQSLQDEIYQAQTNRQKTKHLISSIQNEISPGLEKNITSLNGLLSSDRLNIEASTKSNLNNILDELKTISHTIANLIPDKNFSDQ